MTVREIMEADPVTVTPTDSVETAARLLREHDLPGLPVVNEGGRCVGIVTENDLVIAEEEGDLHVPRHIDLLGGTIYLESVKHFEQRLQKAFAVTVDQLMTHDPITIGPDEPVEAAARLIARERHNRLPVVEHGRLVGMVTRLDVMGALHGRD